MPVLQMLLLPADEHVTLQVLPTNSASVAYAFHDYCDDTGATALWRFQAVVPYNWRRAFGRGAGRSNTAL